MVKSCVNLVSRAGKYNKLATSERAFLPSRETQNLGCCICLERLCNSGGEPDKRPDDFGQAPVLNDGITAGVRVAGSLI